MHNVGNFNAEWTSLDTSSHSRRLKTMHCTVCTLHFFLCRQTAAAARPQQPQRLRFLTSEAAIMQRSDINETLVCVRLLHPDYPFKDNPAWGNFNNTTAIERGLCLFQKKQKTNISHPVFGHTVRRPASLFTPASTLATCMCGRGGKLRKAGRHFKASCDVTLSQADLSL